MAAFEPDWIRHVIVFVDELYFVVNLINPPTDSPPIYGTLFSGRSGQRPTLGFCCANLINNGIDVPRFQVFERGSRVRRRSALPFPLIVKSRTEEASLGLARASLVADERVAALYGDAAHESLGDRHSQTITVPEGEAAKTPAEAARLWNALRLDRDGTLVSLGGGSTNDLAGFAAATYVRGVRWVPVPTTLVGQVDAAIGGAQSGAGKLVVIEGPAGIGKTSLLAEGRARATASGLTVLYARASELESAFSFGIVRQFFEAAVATASEEEQSRLLGGAAAQAARLFGAGPSDASSLSPSRSSRPSM